MLSHNFTLVYSRTQDEQHLPFLWCVSWVGVDIVLIEAFYPLSESFYYNFALAHVLLHTFLWGLLSRPGRPGTKLQLELKIHCLSFLIAESWGYLQICNNLRLFNLFCFQFILLLGKELNIV